MKMTGNTILITGGGSGIGKSLAEAFHARGNQVIIAGRRAEALASVTSANPGMKYAEVDLMQPTSIAALAAHAATAYPTLNVLINNAGVMQAEDLLASAGDPALVETTIGTNLLAPIRLTAALLPLLRRQERATVMMVSSGLAFLPLAMAPTYCASKAAIHSYAQSLRYQLRETAVDVVELAPPYVATALMGLHQATDPRAMPLGEFTAEVMELLETQPEAVEICVRRVFPLRFAAGKAQAQYDEMFEGLNRSISAPAVPAAPSPGA